MSAEMERCLLCDRAFGDKYCSFCAAKSDDPVSMVSKTPCGVAGKNNMLEVMLFTNPDMIGSAVDLKIESRAWSGPIHKVIERPLQKNDIMEGMCLSEKAYNDPIYYHLEYKGPNGTRHVFSGKQEYRTGPEREQARKSGKSFWAVILEEKLRVDPDDCTILNGDKEPQGAESRAGRFRFQYKGIEMDKFSNPCFYFKNSLRFGRYAGEDDPNDINFVQLEEISKTHFSRKQLEFGISSGKVFAEKLGLRSMYINGRSFTGKEGLGTGDRVSVDRKLDYDVTLFRDIPYDDFKKQTEYFTYSLFAEELTASAKIQEYPLECVRIDPVRPALKSFYYLGVSRIVVGRDKSSSLFLDDRTVPSNHALLLKTPSGLAVKDLGSKNGTWVNGSRIPEGKGVQLHFGDKIRFGRVEYQVEP